MKRVAVSSASFAKDAVLVGELRALGAEVVLNSVGRPYTAPELADFLRATDPDILILGTEPLTQAALESAPRLKLVAKYGVGLDNVDEADLARRGITLGWTPGSNRRSVAELALAFMLGHARNVFPSVHRMRQGMWSKDGGRLLSGQRVGIVGFGHTGSDLAALLVPFDCQVGYADLVDKTSVARPLGAVPVPYHDLVTSSDILSFHVPLTSQTKGMFGVRELARVRSHAVVVNTSRGEVVDFDATCEAVVAGRLGAFASDVFPVEPCDLAAHAGCERLYFTPHIGGNAREAVLAMGRAALAHVAAAIGPRTQ